MRYIRYGALKDRTVQRLPKHCVCHSNNTFIFNQQTKYTTDCTLKTAAAATRAGGATEAVSRGQKSEDAALSSKPNISHHYKRATKKEQVYASN